MKSPATFGYVDEGGVATITLARPDRLNALTFEMYAELRDLFAALAHESGVRAVVITGEGRGFCSGGDVDAIIGELLKQDMTQLVVLRSVQGVFAGALMANTFTLVADVCTPEQRTKMQGIFFSVAFGIVLGSIFASVHNAVAARGL